MRIQTAGQEAGQADRLRDQSQAEHAQRSAEPEKESALQQLHRFVWGGPAEQAVDAEFGRRAGTLWEALTDALADARKHVVEEGWFGREVTPAEVELNVPPSFEELMRHQAAMQPRPPDLDPNSPSPAQNGPDR